MPIPAESDVQAMLADFHVRLRQVVDDAWQEWLELPGRGRFVFLARVRACMVFEFIARRAIAEFEGDEHIRVLTKRQTVQFLFRDCVLVRFKKSNDKGIGSNIETQAVLDFIDPQRTIPGLVPDIMRVEVCYRPDDLGIDLSEVAVVARSRHKRVWAYPINKAEPIADVVPLPLRGPDDTPPIVEPRQPKPDEKTQD